MNTLIDSIVWLNSAFNVLGKAAMAPIAILPGWLSASLVAVASGVFVLWVFKHTSNQPALRRVNNDIAANLLAIKLFRDSPEVVLRSQSRILRAAALRVFLNIMPMSIISIPMMLLLVQLALWYQARPFRLNEEGVVAVRLRDHGASAEPDIRLDPTEAVEVLIGPVRVQSQREVVWSIRARQNGYHRLSFGVGTERIEKELAIGEGFMRVGNRRPTWQLKDTLLHPQERPFSPESSVESIEVQYPSRNSWTCGTNTWLGYWFVGTMITVWGFRRPMNVKV